MKPGDVVLMVNHTAKAFEPKYKKETYSLVKVNATKCASGITEGTSPWYTSQT